MNKSKSATIIKTINNIKKMPCGRVVEFSPLFYGTLKAYRAKNGKRMFSLSKSLRLPNGGNLSLETVLDDINAIHSKI